MANAYLTSKQRKGTTSRQSRQAIQHAIQESVSEMYEDKECDNAASTKDKPVESGIDWANYPPAVDTPDDDDTVDWGAYRPQVEIDLSGEWDLAPSAEEAESVPPIRREVLAHNGHDSNAMKCSAMPCTKVRSSNGHDKEKDTKRRPPYRNHF